MPKKDPRIDAYIARAGDFAKPILNHIRKLVHSACPEVEETIKWSSPFYVYNGILVATPAFKKHCALIFWKGKFVLGKERKELRHLTSISELPAEKILLDLLKKAVELNEAGTKEPARPKPKVKKEIVVPDYFVAALKKNKKAMASFENFSPSHKREYVEWIIDAKREETRGKRIQTAIHWMTSGKSRHWKYQ
jgi:uncharacterized protein YdeI (YjbR/CyaY-like superfamily)